MSFLLVNFFVYFYLYFFQFIQMTSDIVIVSTHIAGSVNCQPICEKREWVNMKYCCEKKCTVFVSRMRFEKNRFAYFATLFKCHVRFRFGQFDCHLVVVLSHIAVGIILLFTIVFHVFMGIVHRAHDCMFIFTSSTNKPLSYKAIAFLLAAAAAAPATNEYICY